MVMLQETSATAVISDTGLAGSAASLSGILSGVTISSGDYAGLSSKNANTLYFYAVNSVYINITHGDIMVNFFSPAPSGVTTDIAESGVSVKLIKRNGQFKLLETNKASISDT